MAGKWESKNPVVLQSWRYNREKQTSYFQYMAPIYKLIYTTNAVEDYHRQVCKVTKPKGAFTSDLALLERAFLATKNIEKKWTAPLHNWGLTLQQLAIKSRDWLPLDLTRSPKNPLFIR